MGKLGLIVQREYLTRVKKKTFLLVTFLTPLAFGLLIFVSGYLASKAENSEKKILVVDDNAIVENYPLKSKTLIFDYTDNKVEDLKKKYIEDGFDMMVHIPAIPDLTLPNFDVNYYSKDKIGFNTIEKLENIIAKSIRNYKLDQSSLDKDAYEQLKTSVTLENALVNEDDESVAGDRSSKTSVGLATGLGFLMGFMMYMVIFVFGGMVMRSVMEEKINRIVEVIVSTVKPFQLMLGKLIGVGAVGLTQLLIWLILIPIIGFVATSIFGSDPSTLTGMDQAQAAEAIQQLEGKDGFDFNVIMQEVMLLNWGLIIPVFIIFFLGGYFIYSSLFAAVGSAIGEDMGEAQQFMLPISIPIIIAFMMVFPVVSNPNGGLAIFGSLFPLTSPLLMPARLPFDPPIWQVLLSIVILVLSVAFFIWLAGRIYRVGIFMHGKKITFKELAKWIRYNY